MEERASAKRSKAADAGAVDGGDLFIMGAYGIDWKMNR
jgi:hypothetical protein